MLEAVSWLKLKGMGHVPANVTDSGDNRGLLPTRAAPAASLFCE